MKKKILLAFLLVMFACSSIFATSWIQLGAVADYGKAVTDEDFAEGFKSIENYGFGAEGRINLFNWVSLALPTTFQFGESFSFDFKPSVNLNIPISFVDIAAGIGTELSFAKVGDAWRVNGFALGKGLRALKYSNLFYRGAVTFNIGVLALGMAAEVPTNGSLADFDMAPNWDQTRISASVLLNLL